MRPPPQPTEETTASLEDLIRSRIVDHNFDDVPRVAPSAPEKRTKTVKMDDKKSGKVRMPAALGTLQFALGWKKKSSVCCPWLHKS